MRTIHLIAATLNEGKAVYLPVSLNEQLEGSFIWSAMASFLQDAAVLKVQNLLASRLSKWHYVDTSKTRQLENLLHRHTLCS